MPPPRGPSHAIPPSASLAFCLILTFSALGAVATALVLPGAFPLGDFRGAFVAIAVVLWFYTYAIGLYRAVLFVRPLREGFVQDDRSAALGYYVYQLFNLFLFHPLTTSHLLPVPIRRLLYLALGARLGRNTYVVGFLLDPPLTTIGSDSLVGFNAIISAHTTERGRTFHSAVRIGNGVTVGAASIVWHGVTVGDGSVVGAAAFVPSGTQIGPGELWLGSPARLVRRLDQPDGNGHAGTSPEPC